MLLVDTRDLSRSAEELEAYQRENPGRPRRRRVSVPILSNGRVGVLAYAAVLLAIAVLANQWAFGLDWFEAGAMQAARVMDGEWWRTVTALTLHGDAGHLTANLVFGTVFGLLAAQALGSGVAWAGILCAGALGNTLNALMQQPGHTSIGASTAVFAALAVVVAHSTRYWGLLAGGPLRRWSPLVGGVLLLAYTGTGGERTDVAAHLTGFIAGLTIGWVGSLAPPEQLRRMWVQATAATLSVGLLVTAWVRALSA
jgi:membrane associated rhomboid family serine protease